MRSIIVVLLVTVAVAQAQPAPADTAAPASEPAAQPRFTPRAIDAMFYGADGDIELAPIPALELGAQASLVRAKNADDGSYLVFVPADHYRGSVTFHLPDLGELHKSFATLTGTYVARQRRYDARADFISPPAAYFLLGAELGGETRLADQTVRSRCRARISLMRVIAIIPVSCGISPMSRAGRRCCASVYFSTHQRREGNHVQA